jgi:hypothetical protein
VGLTVGDVALGNVPTIERHAQRSDIVDALRPLQGIGDLKLFDPTAIYPLVTLRDREVR